MTKTGWQYTAIFLASVLLLSNAAQYNSRCDLEAELAQRIEAERLQSSRARSRPIGSITDGALADSPLAQALATDSPERCISGIRFRRIPGGWEQLQGTC